MCGIYGSTVIYNAEILREKLAIAGFRGPDHSAYEVIGNVVLGHNRLAIVDLDARSDQPFTYLHLKIVFNGEIYNYIELRATLKKSGYLFRTNSDTEVLAAAYLAYGKGCVDHFNGMFSFVIYDTNTQTIFGARDRLGKKPFYYCHQGKTFEFASQPSQIAYAKNMDIDQQAIHQYFIWGYVPEPKTIWQQIKKLAAGHWCSFNLNTGEFYMEKYWDVEPHRGNYYTGNYQQATQHLNNLLTDAVAIRMHADVDLGVFLSGGIDSSLIAAMAAKQTSRVNTFCVKFSEQGFNESTHAELVAAKLGTRHHTIECRASDGLELIDEYAKYYDEPFADPSAIPTLLLNKYTKKYVTVALGGDGGDESFMGYQRYMWLDKVNFLFNYPLSLRKLMAGPLKLSPNYRHKLIGKGICQQSIQNLYGLMLGGLEYGWLTEPERGLNVPHMNIWTSPGKSFLKKMSSFDIKTYLNGDINTKMDRGSMAFAIESRSPLMDYRIVEFALSLPDHYKISGNVQKRILKDVLYSYLPRTLFQRPKSGFSVPMRHWFRSELKSYVLDMLSPNELTSIPGIDPLKTSAMIQEHLSGRWNRSTQIWKLLVFKQWQKNQQYSTSHIEHQRPQLITAP